MDAPIYYDYATVLNNLVIPGSVHPFDNIISKFYTDYLLKRAMTVLVFDGIPDTWDKNYFLYELFGRGRVAVIDTPQFGVIPQGCNLAGYNIYYRPVTALIANPALPPSLTGAYRIDESYNPEEKYLGDAVLIQLQPNFKGIMDICELSASRLAYMHSALQMNLANSKFAYIFGAKDKNAAETFKAAFDEIQNGNYGVAVGKGLWDETTGKPLWEGFINNLRQNYIATDLLENIRAEMTNFDSFLGIPNTSYTKKAHMTVDEINANDVETETLVDLMLECVSKGIQRVNAKYGMSLSVRKRYDQHEVKEEAVSDGAE